MTDGDQHLAQRVEIVSALVAAIERRADVVAAIGSSATEQDTLAVQALLGVAAELAELRAQLPS